MVLMREEELRNKLRKIELLFSGTNNQGEKLAAADAIKRIKDQLAKVSKMEKLIELRVAIPDLWERKLFMALCRRYDIKPYRYRGQRFSTVMVKAPRSFIDDVLWAEFLELKETLYNYIEPITEKIIREEIHKNINEADEL